MVGPAAQPASAQFGSGFITNMDGHLGGVACSGAYQVVPEESGGQSLDPPGPRWLGIALAIIGIVITVVGIYLSLQDDPENTYEYEIYCRVDGYTVWADGEGGLLRQVTLYYVQSGESQTGAACEYVGDAPLRGGTDLPVSTGSSCRATQNFGEELEWQAYDIEDILPKTAQPCFQPAILARNSPQIDALGVVYPTDEKALSDFHPGGKCAGDVDIDWQPCAADEGRCVLSSNLVQRVNDLLSGGV